MKHKWDICVQEFSKPCEARLCQELMYREQNPASSEGSRGHAGSLCPAPPHASSGATSGVPRKLSELGPAGPEAPGLGGSGLSPQACLVPGLLGAHGLCPGRGNPGEARAQVAGRVESHVSRKHPEGCQKGVGGDVQGPFLRMARPFPGLT